MISNYYNTWPECDDKELGYVMEVFHSKKFGGVFPGSKNERFESRFADFCGVEYCLTVSNGTVALYTALKALGIGPGDEVIVPAMTYIATASAVSLCGAVPVFVDVDSTSCNIDVQKFKSMINEKSRAVIPVHLWGNVCEIKQIVSVANEHNMYVVEDCCQAIGAEFEQQKVGTFGDIGIFSFAPTKSMTCGEGGACITKDYSLYERMCEMRNHGRFTGGDYFHKSLGWNFRLSEFSAAILLGQLDKFQQQLIDKNNNYNLLLKLLDENHIYWLKPLKIMDNSVSSIFGPTFIYISEELGGMSLEQVINKLLDIGVPVGNRKRIAICDNPIYSEPECRDYCENIKGDVTVSRTLELLIFGQPIGYSILTGGECVRKFVFDLAQVRV